MGRPKLKVQRQLTQSKRNQFFVVALRKHRAGGEPEVRQRHRAGVELAQRLIHFASMRSKLSRLIGVALLCASGCGPTAGGGDAGGSGSGAETRSTSPASASGMQSASGTAATMTTADDTAGTTAPGALPLGCACVVPNDDALDCDGIARTRCEGDRLCPVLSGTCGRPNPDMYPCRSELEYDDDVVTCVLQALRDRAPGKVQISQESGTCGQEGCGLDLTEVYIAAEGVSLLRTCGSSPLNAETSASATIELAAPDHFAGCLDLTSNVARVRCLEDGLGERTDAC